MKKLLFCLLVSGSVTSFANTDGCKGTAIKVAKAIDKVYVPKLSKGT